MRRLSDEKLTRGDEAGYVTAADCDRDLLRGYSDIAGGIYAGQTGVGQSIDGHEPLISEVEAEAFREPTTLS